MSTPSSPRRYLSIWLRRLATDRLTRCRRYRPDEPAAADAPARPDEAAPLVVARKVKSAQRIAALNDAAARLGLTAGLALADACARHPGLAIAQADPEADQRLLEAVADWCDRYTPLVALDAPTGLMLDISGCAHLFGGETALANDIITRLAAQGLHARIAVAGTPGCAWAVARYGVWELQAPGWISGAAFESCLTSPLEGEVDQGRRAGLDREGGSFNPSLQSLTPLPPPPPQGGREQAEPGEREHTPRGERENVFIIPAAATSEALAPLPLAALRLEEDTVTALAAVGLHRVADVLNLPRATLAARFGDFLLLRLDQALGRVEEPITPRLPAPSFMAEQHFAEPVVRERDVLGAISRLSIRLGYAMEARGEGARRLELALFRTDGTVHRLAVGTSTPVRAADQIGRLFRDRLASLTEPCDPGFGYDLVRLSAPVTERLAPVQADFAAGELTASTGANEDLAHLIDRLGARFGVRRVTCFVPRDTHIPEFAVAHVPAHAARAYSSSPVKRGRGTVRRTVEGVFPQSNSACPLHHTRSQARADCASFTAMHGPPPPFHGGGYNGQDTLAPTRPVRLFARPEPIEAIAEVPDGPPVRFRWRRVLHEVAAAEGPERIALEWWRDAGVHFVPEESEFAPAFFEGSHFLRRTGCHFAGKCSTGHALTRDYFRVESRAGARVWLFREGLYGRETVTPRWFLHGLFG